MNLDAPIPGGNFLSDTRNYAWHRPPEIVDYDEAVGYIIDKIDQPEEIETVHAMLGIDAHITTIVTTMLLQTVAKGKIGIDLAILIAGPIARYVEIAAKDVGIKYEMGVEDKDRAVLTPSLLKVALGILDQDEEVEQENIQEPDTSAASGGLMSMPDQMTASQDEQNEMLGITSEAPEVEEVEEDVV